MLTNSKFVRLFFKIIFLDSNQSYNLKKWVRQQLLIN